MAAILIYRLRQLTSCHPGEGFGRQDKQENYFAPDPRKKVPAGFPRQGQIR
jgi:hypothetical protein